MNLPDQDPSSHGEPAAKLNRPQAKLKLWAGSVVSAVRGVGQVQPSQKGPIGRYIEQVFGMDLRALALFRIGLALLILMDLLYRLPNLRLHYTDFGVMPRAALITEFTSMAHWSLHYGSGAAIYQLALFGVSAVLALALLVGYRTRLVTVLSWLMLISLHLRNPMILSGGDMTLRMLLFWGMFLPLGSRFSLDRALNTPLEGSPLLNRQQRILSGGTVALVLQVIFIYAFTLAHRAEPTWWRGLGVYYALNIDQLATPLGVWFRNFPDLMLVSNYLTLALEGFCPLLLLVAWRQGSLRTAVVTIMVLTHFGFGLFLELGLFPFFSALAWLPFLPTELWDRLAQRLRTPARMGLKIYYDGGCGFCRKMTRVLRTLLLIPETPLIEAQSDPGILQQMEARNSWVVVDHQGGQHYKFWGVITIVKYSPLFAPLAPVLAWAPVRHYGRRFYEWVASHRQQASQAVKWIQPVNVQDRPSRFLSMVAASFLLYIFLWNLSMLSYTGRLVPRGLGWIGQTLAIEQNWTMFAPRPLREDGWFVIPGELRDGTSVDVFRNGAPVSWSKPDRVTYPDAHIFKQMINLIAPRNERQRLYYGRYLCRSWNSSVASDDRQLMTFTIAYMMERTQPPSQPPIRRRANLWNHRCFAEDAAETSSDTSATLPDEATGSGSRQRATPETPTNETADSDASSRDPEPATLEGLIASNPEDPSD